MRYNAATEMTLVPQTGLEPVSREAGDFKSPVFTYFTTEAHNHLNNGPILHEIASRCKKLQRLGSVRRLRPTGSAACRFSWRPIHPGLRCALPQADGAALYRRARCPDG